MERIESPPNVVPQDRKVGAVLRDRLANLLLMEKVIPKKVTTTGLALRDAKCPLLVT